MPRLHGRERINANLYDALEPMTAFASGNTCRLFSNPATIGKANLTNMLTPGCLASDQTMTVFGLYARTNVKSHPIWDEWLQQTTATLYIGDKMMITSPLSELVAGRLGSEEPPDTDRASRLAFALHADKDPDDDELTAWQRRDDDVRAFWESRARCAMRVLRYRKPWIIPVGFAFHVLITTEAISHGLMVRHYPTITGACLDPMVWIHAEGLLTRALA